MGISLYGLHFGTHSKSSIHNNPDLTDIDKFNYLHSLLEHTAAEAIAGLTLSSSNYKGAIALLKKRFGCKQQLISKHMEAFLTWKLLHCHVTSRISVSCMIRWNLTSDA